jgi:H+/Cl- antiporter ClcA
MSDTSNAPMDPGAVIRSRAYRRVLVFAAIIGIFVSLLCWIFLWFVHKLQHWVFHSLPDALGYHEAPWWWPLPVLAIAGLVTAFAIVRLPGHGGHEPLAGIKTGKPTLPEEVPGVVLAALATLGLGLVLGPEGPLIAIGAGLAIFAVRLVKRDAPEPMLAVLAAAGSFAAIASVFGSPVIGAIIIIEAAGLGGAALPVILVPGLLASGIGALVFLGMGDWSGLSSSDWSLSPLPLEPYDGMSVGDFGWTIALALVVPVVVLAIMEVAKLVRDVVVTRPFLFTTAAGVVVALLAIAFHQATDESANAVLFSGQEELAVLFESPEQFAVSTLWLLLLFKGLAWSVSLASFRGGSTFPAIFLGATGGLLAARLPEFAEPAAVAVVMAAATVCVLRLPLASLVLTGLLTAQTGISLAPLVIVSVVVAYITTESLHAWRTPTSEPALDGEIAAATTAIDTVEPEPTTTRG